MIDDKRPLWEKLEVGDLKRLTKRLRKRARPIVVVGASFLLAGMALAPGRVYDLQDGQVRVRSFVVDKTTTKNPRVYAYSTVVFLTSGTSYTVPDDWNNSSNRIECIGGGGSGGGARNGTGSALASGGSGGAYASITNLTLSKGASVAYQVGQGGASVNSGGSNGNTNGNDGTDTWFNGTSLSDCSCGAEGGFAGNGTRNATAAGVAGGQASSSVGSLKYSGGASGAANTGPLFRVASGGGGAAGPHGNGGSSLSTADNGNTSTGGGTGDAGNTAANTNGTQWDATHGAGGGGDGVTASTDASPGGLYGAGGGGIATFNSNLSSGAGANGIIVVSYDPGGSAEAGIQFRAYIMGH